MNKRLADDFVTVIESPNPQHVYCYNPGMCVLPDGRIIATMNYGGPGVKEMDGWKGRRYEREFIGKLFISDDGGSSWREITEFPFLHARPFIAGDSLYLLGHAERLMIMRSDDRGDTWSEPVYLTDAGDWHQAPCNVHYANDCIYLVMENIYYHDVTFFPACLMAPILMRAKVKDDLTRPESWHYASPLVARDAIPSTELDYFGVPFYTEHAHKEMGNPESSPIIGWLETNVVQFVDPDHYWYDPTGRTFHLWMRTLTGGTGYAAIAKVVEHEDGTMTTMLEETPSGKKAAFVPCPGGQMKFHIVYDEQTRLYWLLSSQSTDSMTRREKLSKERYGLPNNERHRLQLHFSRNCIDWCHAGMVAIGPSPKQSRHYASMAIRGDDLLVLSRSGDDRASSAHNGNLITFHVVKNFRTLVY